MSAQEAEIIDIKQGQLFEMPRIVEGAITLTQIRKLPLHAEQTATLMKDGQFGEGHAVQIVAGSGVINGFAFKDGRLVFTVEVESVEVEL